MGQQSETFHGSRAKILIDGQVIGIFNNVSYGVNYDANPIHILGSFAPKEIVLSGQDAITVQASGFRIIGKGPYNQIQGAKVPKLQDLLNHEDISIAIIDRQSGEQIMSVVGARPSGFNSTLNARGVTEIQVTFVGTVLSDEEGDQQDAGSGDAAPTSL